MTILNRFQSFNKEHALFRDDEKVLLAVSAGRDSVLMAHLFKDAGHSFGIAHCNFMLRNEDSIADEQFCYDLAESLEVPFFTTVFDTANYSEKHHVSIQMAARELRYQWLEEIRSDFDYSYIAVAHHQNDVIETMLLNLTRGTGIAGLHGILPKRDKLIRPLLFLTREEIDHFIEAGKYSYREDSSNISVKYARNKIRHLVIPALKELNPSLERTFEANRKRFSELEMIFDQRISELKKTILSAPVKGTIEIDLDALKKLTPLSTLLFGLFQPYGFSEKVLNDLSNSWDGIPGKTFSSGTYDLLLDRHKLILSKITRKHSQERTIQPTDDKVAWNELNFNCRITDHANHEIVKNSAIAQLDFDLLTFPLILRSWKEGDYFYPQGMNGKKKLSDLFIGAKIPLNQKNKVPVLVNGNDDILWIGGLRTDKRYLISSGTKKVFIFEQSI